MLSHYLKVALRNLSRNKVFSFINILGLAVSMGVCLLIYQYIHFEMSFDDFHEKSIYRLTREDFRGGEIIDRGISVQENLGPLGLDAIPEIRNMVRVHDSFEDLVFTTKGKKKVFQGANYWYVDSTFFDVFTFLLKYGNAKNALTESHHIVITEEIAVRYFGNVDPIGKEIEIHGGSLSGSFTVSSVLSSIPTNSHLQFDFLMPMEFLTTNWRMYREGNGWDQYSFATYIELDGKSNLSSVESKFDQIILDQVGEELLQHEEQVKIYLQAVSDIHLYSDFPDELVHNGGNKQQIQFYALIAIFILVIAWVNYINLSTAQSLKRIKEIGVRKSIGAFKRQLVMQFMTESLVHNLIGGLVALGLAHLCLPVLNEFIGQTLSFSLFYSIEFWLIYALVIILGALLAGAYPAFVVAGFQSIGLMGSKNNSSVGSASFRKGLIVFQFMISILLVSGTYVVHRQTSYMMNQDLGVNMEEVLVVNGPRVVLKLDRDIQLSKFKNFRNQLTAHHSIMDVSGSSHTPGQKFSWVGEIRKLGTPREAYKNGYVVFTDSHFANTYDLQFVSGGGYESHMTSYEDGLIINEAAVRAFDLGTAEQALKEQLIVSIGDTLRILGVVADVHWQSLKDAHYPMVFALHQFDNVVFSANVKTNDMQETLAMVQTAYQENFPNDPFSYHFLDESFNRQYQADLQFGNLFAAFSALAIFIACLGLFALVSFSATLRMKEIGIRKVLGAKIGHLMMLLSKEYLYLLLIANVLALPAVWYWGSDWLNNYAFKIDMNIDLFVIPGLMLLVISTFTVSYQTFSTAKANPVDSLRSE
ncbi:MAG: FtsX-like permease family protein [Reichenbachiella sp.]|uniref:ABC transporter permease n=1 Tax=Reichenbachiella sp. TaxID=2184521 RepID=UPI00296720BC|nr:FtsX-like permease family protein [Reichenbachiella sp.]MDW3209480.1 FtsX-like permease family protein [Reichenbachiella sp.]